jgi:integrase
MMALGVPVKAVQEHLGHSRPDILLNYYVDVLDESEMAAAALSTRLGGGFSAPNRLRRSLI